LWTLLGPSAGRKPSASASSARQLSTQQLIAQECRQAPHGCQGSSSVYASTCVTHPGLGNTLRPPWPGMQPRGTSTLPPHSSRCGTPPTSSWRLTGQPDILLGAFVCWKSPYTGDSSFQDLPKGNAIELNSSSKPTTSE